VKRLYVFMKGKEKENKSFFQFKKLVLQIGILEVEITIALLVLNCYSLSIFGMVYFKAYTFL